MIGGSTTCSDSGAKVLPLCADTVVSPVVVGYHGTSGEVAAAIVSGRFQLSSNEYDWLGDGIYFFQDAPRRAWDWAKKFHGASAAVVGANISLEDCLDLLDITWSRFLSSAYDTFVAKLKSVDRPLPVQRGGAHRMDRHVINYAVGVLADKGFTIKSVRAAFSEGKPVFPNSALLDRSHVQIAVRETGVIKKAWLLESGKELLDVNT